MRDGKHLCYGVLFAVLLPCAVLAQSRPLQDDPVESLRQLLSDPAADPVRRARELERILPRFNNVNDLRRALALHEWCDRNPDTHLATVDRAVRKILAERFLVQTRRVLQQGDATLVLAVINLLSEMGTSVRGPGAHGLAHELGPDLAGLTRTAPAEVRAAAAAALGRIEADAGVASPALADLLKQGDDEQRAAAAGALHELLERVSRCATRSPEPDSTSVTRSDWIRAACAILPAAGRGLSDRLPEVRRRCAATVVIAATTLAELVPDSRSVGQAEAARAELPPLCSAFREQGGALTRALTDADADVRRDARRALEMLVEAQARLKPIAAASTGSELQRVGHVTPAAPAEISAELTRTLQALAGEVGARDPRDRKAALDTLAALGPSAAPAVPVIASALADPDRFVRWTAIRALGRVGPVHTEQSVPALARQLRDPDVDLRRAAAGVLEHFGPSAAAALPALVQSMSVGDAEERVAVIRAVGAIGPLDGQAVGPLGAALSDPGDQVRREAARALGRFGPAAAGAVASLRRALRDENAEVRQAASDALLRIVQPAATLSREP